MLCKIIGHRGDKAKYIENTLSGFQSALETEGVDGFELDVVVSKDKKLVVSHDMFITDPLSKKRYIHTLTYADLLTLSTIVNINLPLEGKPYPLLEDVLKLYVEQTSKKILLLEIKSLPALETLPLSCSGLIGAIHTLLETYQILEECYIISFDYRLLVESKKQDEKRKVGLILHRNLIPLNCMLSELNISLLVMEKEWITKEQVIQAEENNVDIFTWTPNTEKEWARLKNLGVKGLVTDTPKALSLFNRDQKE